MKLSLDQYVKERDEMLMKRNVDEFRKFIKKWKKAYDKLTYEVMSIASDDVLEITMHKMIVNVTDMPKELKQDSIYWLSTRGYSAKLF